MQLIIKGILKIVLPLVFLGLLVLGFLNLNSIFDWWRLLDYKPPTAISQLAGQDTMTAYARHIFYLNQPIIETNAAQFKKDCTVFEQTIVLGCYHGSENGIFLYQVNDSRLDGIMQVTSAHEMLHGVYDRLSQKDKSYVDSLLQDYYSKNLTDQRIIDTINSYKQTEPNDVVDEMHSVFGTEISSLPPALESYYTKYFANRSVVVADSEKYESEFTTRVNRIKSYESQLATLKQKIDSEEASISTQSAKIQADRANLDSLRTSGNLQDYNAAVPAFNSEVDAYNNLLAQLRSDINTYNGIVAAYNGLADELRSLYQSISGTLSQQNPQ